ncbi:inhibitor of nuclear factor kappa-B kinase subunit beta-like isoform X2 [Dendronephthya gigantea]|uniref:inhibitor of nuclear factor kappa-B kinase subunit beta-like isoform X2 n=1 Tax=Dendronephthya gigantea TaxID=151771 RepID=UPI001069F268|nr:inhibitor of nuclear factor kappa-B kinase subunit beta-like isoform X2 [Dendronephthya gigantea]
MAEKRKVGDWIESGYLGHGTFGIVKLWHNEKTKVKIALKTCHNDPQLSEKSRERWRQEVEFLKTIKHPNIIQTRPLPPELANEQCDAKSLPALCMEYCEGGDLRKTLSTAENCNGLKESMVIRVCEDIANAIECLHKEKIAHRDIKPENIVICPNGNRNIYKLIDLGYAKQADQSGSCHSFVGTHFYLAPEILTGKTYTLTVDLWSYGILLYECCTGLRPFPAKCQEVIESLEKKDQDIIAATLEEENGMLVYWDKLPEVNRLNRVLQRKFEELLRMLLDGDPTRRGSSETGNGTRSWKNCIEEIKNTQVIEVFCIELYKQFVYELTSDLSVHDLKLLLAKDTKIPVENQELFIHDGSDLSEVTLLSSSSNMTAFVFNKAFDPRLEMGCKNELPSSLCKMLEDPEGFTKRSMRWHLDVYKHSVFFINKQLASNKCITRGVKALVIRLLKWSRKEFTVRSDVVSREVTLLESAVSFFTKSLKTDLKNYCGEHSRSTNGISKDLPNFEDWRQMEKGMDIHNLSREASDVFRKKAELQNRIATIKNNERVSKTPERSMIYLNQRAKEIQKKYESVKARMSPKRQEVKSSSLKDEIKLVPDTIEMIQTEVKKINGEFYRFIRELFKLRHELEIFIPALNFLEKKVFELRGNLQEFPFFPQWQLTRQEQIWQLFSRSKDAGNVTQDQGTQQRPFVKPKRRSPGIEIVKQSQEILLRLKDNLNDVRHKQEIFKNQIEELDWSFCNVSDSEDTVKSTEDPRFLTDKK